MASFRPKPSRGCGKKPRNRVGGSDGLTGPHTPAAVGEEDTMQGSNVIIAQNNPHSAEFLAASLHSHFRAVYVARNADELRLVLRKRRPEAAVLDLELIDAPEVQA